MDGFMLAAVAILAVMTGFWVGRSMQWRMVDFEDEETGEEEAVGRNATTIRNATAVQGVSEKISETILFGRRKKNGNLRRISLGKEIASPTAGEMTVAVENGRRVVHIQPKEGKLYAPAAGKIVRLFPMGCAMVLRTEFGTEILLRAGEHVDEMCSMYYRCRVMEREVVKKGSLLLEFDLEGLRLEGADAEVTMSLENESVPEYVPVQSSPQIKVGETILCI